MFKLSHLFEKYNKYTPTFRYIVNKFFNNQIKIDHIAHRSFKYKSLINFYTENSFILKKDKYYFPHMNVNATWLKSPFEKEFRVFVSQYDKPHSFYIKNYEDYIKIKKENDYVAWTLLHNDDINHIAILVDDIYKTIDLIKQDGTIQLNNENNPVTVSRDGNLLQASTVSDKILYRFPDNEFHIVPYAFVEFIQRKNGREGFESMNAAKIFKSTNL
jgi:4-hydroxyphenylpyruvate dioxygenase-like putative hemolysin